MNNKFKEKRAKHLKDKADEGLELLDKTERECRYENRGATEKRFWWEGALISATKTKISGRITFRFNNRVSAKKDIVEFIKGKYGDEK